MNRREFIAQLKRRLRNLPFDEIKEAVDYYEQYFDDAGEENEQAVLAELGSPAGVASQIIADFAVKDAGAENSAKRGLSIVWLVILAVFASPIALPLAMVVVVLALVLVTVMLAVIFSLGATGLALLLSGAACAIISFFVIAQSFATTLFYLGTGLVTFGVGAIILTAVAALSKKCFGWLAKSVGRFILRRNGK